MWPLAVASIASAHHWRGWNYGSLCGFVLIAARPFANSTTAIRRRLHFHGLDALQTALDHARDVRLTIRGAPPTVIGLGKVRMFTEGSMHMAALNEISCKNCAPGPGFPTDRSS
jgi:hypothetical protein